MDIRDISDEGLWTDFLDRVQPPTFTQSWSWKIFAESSGHVTDTFGLFDGNELLGVCLGILQHARRGRIYTVGHGPILATLNHEEFYLMQKAILERARAARAHWLRQAPLLPDTNEWQQEFSRLGFRSSPTHLYAERSLVIDLSQKPEDILRNMRKTTRHEIQRAHELGITVEFGLDQYLLEAFLLLYRETILRQKFIAFSLEYINREIEVFKESGRVTLGLARFQNKPVAAAVFIQAHGSTFYHHGASATGARDLPAAHLLQCQAILRAREQGFRYYNFWGVAPPERKNHAWSGLSLFKRGFGGAEIAHLATQDHILSPNHYWPIWLFESYMRRRKSL